MLERFEDREDLCLAWAFINALRVIVIILNEMQMFEILQARADIMDDRSALNVTGDLGFVTHFAAKYGCTVTTATHLTIDEAFVVCQKNTWVLCRIYDPEGRPHTVSPQYNDSGWVCSVDGPHYPRLHRTDEFNTMLAQRAQESPFNAMVISRA